MKNTSGKRPDERATMRGKNTIFINGQHYDAVTGLPIELAKPPVTASIPAHAYKVISDFGPVYRNKSVQKSVLQHPVVNRPTAINKVHATPQRSQTLRREVVKRPVGTFESTTQRYYRKPAPVAKSSAITRFASHPLPRIVEPAVASVIPTKHKLIDIQPAIVTKIHRAVAQKVTAAHPVKTPAMSSRELKEYLIAEKLASVDSSKKTPSTKLQKKILGQPRLTSIISACFALIVLGGYLTYLNMPNLSVRVAAAQSGVNARFPEYHPDGYHFNGPIAYAPGEVSMKFQSNGGPATYEIKQKISSWDSQAVLDNYVTKQSNTYLTYSEQGLTVYTYGSHAAWVNGGVLYTLEGNAPLSNEQVLHIASSM